MVFSGLGVWVWVIFKRSFKTLRIPATVSGLGMSFARAPFVQGVRILGMRGAMWKSIELPAAAKSLKPL